jgi:quinol monooxygenase YgiN
MVIVCGYLIVDDRADYLAGCGEVVAAARAAPGCLDFALSADLLDPSRINILERWVDPTALAAFRGDGTGEEQDRHIREARVNEYDVAD